jgi:hypothetical protein
MERNLKMEIKKCADSKTVLQKNKFMHLRVSLKVKHLK